MTRKTFPANAWDTSPNFSVVQAQRGDSNKLNDFNDYEGPQPTMLRLRFEYAYTFPGMNRVLRAIGREIRSETNRGVVLLIDARFNELRYRRLFPTWWKFTRVRHLPALVDAIGDFWKRAIAEKGQFLPLKFPFLPSTPLRLEFYRLVQLAALRAA